MPTHLPEISAMRWPALRSITRGIHVAEGGIQLTRSYPEVMLEQASLRDFVAHFGFTTPSPLCYLYTLIQRAQLHLMLSKDFTIAAPGMVHLENELQKHADYLPGERFDLEVSVTVNYKESGSLIPISTVDLYQRGTLVASNRSVYLARRKSKSGSRKQPAEAAPFGPADYQKDWDLPANLGSVYAGLSGDRNPIHTSTFVAKLLGFPGRILHGWYSVCGAERLLEHVYGKPATAITVKFLAPVLLPSRPRLEMRAGEANSIRYRLIHPADASVLLEGELEIP